MPSRREVMAAMICCMPLAVTARASAFARPQGVVLLVVDGAIQRHNAGASAHFDRAMLDDLPQTSFTTTTIWTEGDIAFSGPSLRTVLDLLAAGPGRITVKAANDYSVTLAPETVNRDFPILAIRKNGQPFSLREAGPIWLVYPFDSADAYSTDLIYSQSVWQLTHLTISSA